jgi:hypothetical protein
MVTDYSNNFTIQDVEKYCCEHPEVNITPVGDNCTHLEINGFLKSCGRG